MKDLWFYFYTIEYWDEASEQIVEDCGFVRAASHADTVSQLSNWYGEDNINSIQTKICDEGDGPLTFDILKSALKEAAYGKK